MINPKEYLRLSPSEKKALLHILIEGSNYAYYLSCKNGIFNTEKTANTALNHLARQSLLEKRVVKKKRVRNYYHLTLKGLCTALVFFDDPNEIWVKIENITKRWGHLFPLLKKHHLFRSHGLEDYFQQTLLNVVREYVLFHGHWHPNNATNMENSFIQKFIRQTEADFMMKWNHVLHEDSELRQKTKLFLEREKKKMEQDLEKFTDRLDLVFPRLGEAEPDWEKIKQLELKIMR